MIRLAAWIVALVVAVVGLIHLSIVGPDQAVLALSGLRLVALALGFYLLAVTTGGVLARLTRSIVLVRTLDIVTLPAVRRMLNGALGVSMVTSVFAGPAAWAAPERPSPPPVMRLVHDAPEPVAPDPVPAPPAAPDAPQEWVVQPGDCFWAIASQVLADQWSRRPTDAEVAPYWRTLVEANRERLRTGDPDLIFPGQRFVVPPVAESQAYAPHAGVPAR